MLPHVLFSLFVIQHDNGGKVGGTKPGNHAELQLCIGCGQQKPDDPEYKQKSGNDSKNHVCVLLSISVGVIPTFETCRAKTQ